MNNIPWTEKYRPSSFNNIILDDKNKDIFNCILNSGYFPNMLFYGPPGTGKTTTIINLINNYQEKYNMKSKSLIIHLNASDERGIDIIRNNIYNFVNSDILFVDGLKFVILDEVDYMTKIAQQSLKCMMQNNININNNKVRYCLICNYISKIDTSLQYEFIKIRFNKLPIKNIISYLKNIIENENLNINNKLLNSIIEYFDNDIRSMINYMQSNNKSKNILLNHDLLNKLFNYNKTFDYENYIKYIYVIQKKCSIDLNYIFKKYVYFLIHKCINNINSDILNKMEFLVHNANNNVINNFICLYFIIIENNKLILIE